MLSSLFQLFLLPFSDNALRLVKEAKRKLLKIKLGKAASFRLIRSVDFTNKQYLLHLIIPSR